MPCTQQATGSIPVRSTNQPATLMRVISLARKPIPGSVAQNVLNHGTGALHVDACRVEANAVLTGGGGKLWSHYRDGTEDRARTQTNPGMGRWPTNLLLQHLPGCRFLGRKIVPGEKPHVRNIKGTNGQGGQNCYGTYRSLPTTIYGHGVDGQETIDEWDCVPGCAVADLDGHGDAADRVAVSRYFKVIVSK